MEVFIMGHQVFSSSLENLQLLSRTKTHAWVADAPVKFGGDGMGPVPFDLLLGSLGACTIVIVTHYAKQSSIPLEKMWVDLEDEWRKEGEEEKYYIKAKIRFAGNLSDEDIKRLRNSAARCPVRRILEKAAVIEEEIQKV
jgi:putative redox protein